LHGRGRRRSRAFTPTDAEEETFAQRERGGEERHLSPLLSSVEAIGLRRRRRRKGGTLSALKSLSLLLRPSVISSFHQRRSVKGSLPSYM